MKKTILFEEKDRTFLGKRPYFLRKKTVLFGGKDRTFWGKRPYFLRKKTVLFLGKDYTFFHNPSPTTSEQIARIVIYY